MAKIVYHCVRTMSDMKKIISVKLLKVFEIEKKPESKREAALSFLMLSLEEDSDATNRASPGSAMWQKASKSQSVKEERCRSWSSYYNSSCLTGPIDKQPYILAQTVCTPILRKKTYRDNVEI